MHRLRRTPSDTNDDVPPRISLQRMGRNVGDKLRGEGNGEWKWRYHLKEGTPVRSENSLEVQTMARPSSFEKEHECDQSQ